MQNQIIGSVKELKTAAGTMLVAFPGSAIVESAATTQTNLLALEPPSGWSPEGVPSEEVWKGAYEVTQLLLEEASVGEYEELITNVNTTLVALDNRAIVESDAIQAYLAEKKAQLEAAAPVAPEATTPVAETTVAEAATTAVTEAAENGNEAAQEVIEQAEVIAEKAGVSTEVAMQAIFGMKAAQSLAAKLVRSHVQRQRADLEDLTAIADFLDESGTEVVAQLQASVAAKALPATAEVPA